METTRYHKILYCRADDVASFSPKLDRFLNIFLDRNIPLHLAIIPKALTKPCKKYLNNKVKSNQDLIEIGQHGFDHKNHNANGGISFKYEFGEKRGYLAQKKSISDGRRILHRAFHKKIKIFTPPWHGFDQQTISLLAKQNFAAISLHWKNRQRMKRAPFFWIPVHMDFNIKTIDGSWFSHKPGYHINKILRHKDQRIGILFHHQHFKEKDFRNLEKFLDICQRFSLKFIPLSQGVSRPNKKRRLRSREIAYFLAYQFLPKTPLALKTETKRCHAFWAAIPKKTFVPFAGIPCLPRPSAGGPGKAGGGFYKKLYLEIQQAVAKRFARCEGPIALLLSGGIDSAIILHMLREMTDRRIYTLTAGFRPLSENFTKSEMLARRYHTRHQTLFIKPRDLQSLKEIYRHDIHAPIGDNGFLSVYLMIKRLRFISNNIFTGDGADCIFGGLKMPDKEKGGWPDTKLYLHTHGEIFLDPQKLNFLFQQKPARMPDLLAPLKHYRTKMLSNNPIKKQILFDLNFLAYNRVDYLETAARINGVEIYLPFLDKQLIRMVLQAPSFILASAQGEKTILRETFRGRLPQDIICAPKKGLTMPFDIWYKENRGFVVSTLIDAKKIGISGAYIKYLLRLLSFPMRYVAGMKIWLMLNLVLWHTQTRQR